MLREGTFTRKKYAGLLLCSITGWIVSLLGGIADSIIAGIFLDSDAVSAVGLISPIGSAAYFLSLLISVGCPLMYSIALGSLDVDKSSKIAGMGVLVSSVLGVVMTITLLIFKNPILGFYRCTGQLYEYTSQYYDTIYVLALIEPMMWTVYSLVNYDGDSRLILIIDIIMAVSNVFFSLLLVKSCGIAGIGIGTALSYVLGLLFTIPHFIKKSNSIHFKFHFSWKDLLQIVKLSSCSAMVTFYIAVVDLLFNKFIIYRFGQNLLPAYTVVNVIMDFASFLLCTISAGLVFITIAYGEKNNYAIRRTMKLVHRSMLITSIVFLTLMIFAAPLWPDIYGITDPVTTDAAIFAGRTIPVTFIFAAITFNYIYFYPAVGRPLEGNILSAAYMLAGPIVLALPLGFAGGFNAMAVGFALTPVFALAVFLIWCLIKKQVKHLPYLLPDNNEINVHYELKLDNESITEVRDSAGIWLAEHEVDPKTSNSIQIIIDETLFHIKNRNKKPVYCECELLLNEDHIRLITKDNGIIFDMLQEADDSLGLDCYVAARMMEKTDEKAYTVTTSFNRNTYIWERVHPTAE